MSEGSVKGEPYPEEAGAGAREQSVARRFEDVFVGGSSDEVARFLALILDGDRRRAARYARRALERHGLLFFYEEIVEPALEAIGQLWYANRISVADEHLATTTAECAIAALYPFLRWPPPGPRALIACAQGERHQLGARMASDLLALDGWDERFLGPDVPIEDLAAKARFFSPRMVGLSVTLPLNVVGARSAIDLIRASVSNVKILVGGRATGEPAVVTELGADAIARCGSEAMEVARGWK